MPMALQPSPPAYSPNVPPPRARPLRAPAEHTFTLTGHKARPWLTLLVKSSAAPGKSHPLYFDKSPVEGVVTLDLESPNHLLAISVSVVAQAASVGADGKPFLEISQTLWSSSAAAEPPSTLPPVLNTSLFQNGAKLQGTYSWPFSIPMPTTVPVNVNGTAGSLRLPPSFSVRGFPAFVEYKLQVLVRRGPLRLDSVLSTSFVYLPRSRPGLPSAMRQLAYLEGHPLPGPEDDPEGWKNIPPVTVKGTAFNSRPAEFVCRLSLSRPLSYARSTPIHFLITIESADSQVLDVLSNPTSCIVRLMQEVSVGNEAGSPAPTVVKPHKVNYNRFHECVSTATVWPCQNGPWGPRVRRLEGEIMVRSDLKPSFSFVRFVLQYHLSVQFEATGFVPSSHEPIFSELVDIVTDRPKGPIQRSKIPRSFSPPREIDTPDEGWNLQGTLLDAGPRFLPGFAAPGSIGW